MRFRGLAKWDNTQNCSGLIYFAQLLEEMLFDFSLDTYKTSVMHTGMLCTEAIQTIREVELGNIKAPNIWHVTAELCSNFERDPVAKALVSLPVSAFFPTLKNQKTPLKELQNTLELLAVQLSPNKYREKNEELLKAEIEGRKSIAEIRRLSRSYVTTLIATGFSQRHLSETTLDFFYFGRNRITGNEAINEFFLRFPYEKEDFTIVFKVDSIFEHMEGALPSIGLSITKNLPIEIDLSSFNSFSNLNDNKLFAIAAKRSARDVYSARSEAEKRLKLAATLLTLFHHKEHPAWTPECIVIDSENKKFKVHKPINSMHKCADLTKSVASKRLELFMSDFSLEKNSFSKFVRSAQLHSMALTSNADENQILNLWISLESLIPSETKNDDLSNIEHIVASLLPFLNLVYIDRLLNNLVKDLLRWNSPITRRAFKPIPGKKFTDKLAKLLALPDFAAQRNSLIQALRDFHLLKDRLDYFQTLFSSPSSVVNALDAHKIRLEWQIRRIYRTRNIIVHTGQTPAYTPLLIAHTHDYLDAVLSSLVNLASKPKIIHSVGQGFKYVALDYINYYDRLSERGLTFDISNIDRLLLNR